MKSESLLTVVDLWVWYEKKIYFQLADILFAGAFPRESFWPFFSVRSFVRSFVAGMRKKGGDKRAGCIDTIYRGEKRRRWWERVVCLRGCESESFSYFSKLFSCSLDKRNHMVLFILFFFFFPLRYNSSFLKHKNLI
jgi:hypothetical protein